jgi:dihydroxy-acid dehydratase
MTIEGTPVQLRTSHWYEGQSRDNYIHRSWMKRGLPDDVFSGRPMIGICNSASELAPCNQHLDELVEHVKRGVWESGGVPLEFPVMSLGETQIQPTSMLLRNLMAMDVEESIRGNPIDGVVLLAGCDKTTPAMVMGAASVDRSAGGPRPRLRHRYVADERGGPSGHPERGGLSRNRIGDDPQ